MAEILGALITSVEGTALSPLERDLLAHPLIGGVILFARNYECKQQLSTLCQSIRAVRPTPLLILVDQEGGRVQRFLNEFTRLPSFAFFGKQYDQHPETASRLAKECGWLMAKELLLTGIDLSLSPVLDLNKQVSQVIGERAFHATPEAVIALSSAFVEGMHEAGMASCGKHFPGHGSVSLDSHTAIPIDQRSFADIEKEDMRPFVALMKTGISAIMAAHIIFPQVDKLAVGFSHRWLNDIVRDKLGYTGTVFTDDLNMEGANISGNYADRVQAAREAGCDFALLCNNPTGTIQAIDQLPVAKNHVAAAKWCNLRGQFPTSEQPLSKNKRWQATQAYLLAQNII